MNASTPGASGPLEALRFLVGRWHGRGTVRGDEVTARIEGSLDPDGSLVLEHTTFRAGAADHRERIVLRQHRGRTSAFIRSGSGAEQRFQSAPAAKGFRFTRADPRAGLMAWCLESDGGDVLFESFVLGEGDAAEIVVALRHVRA